MGEVSISSAWSQVQFSTLCDLGPVNPPLWASISVSLHVSFSVFLDMAVRARWPVYLPWYFLSLSLLPLSPTSNISHGVVSSSASHWRSVTALAKALPLHACSVPISLVPSSPLSPTQPARSSPALTLTLTPGAERSSGALRSMDTGISRPPSLGELQLCKPEDSVKGGGTGQVGEEEWWERTRWLRKVHTRRDQHRERKGKEGKEGVEITSHEHQRQRQRHRETHRFPPGRAGRGEERQSWERKAGGRNLMERGARPWGTEGLTGVQPDLAWAPPCSSHCVPFL